MIDDIKSLMTKYRQLGLTIPKTLITEDQKRRTVMHIRVLASNEWGLFKRGSDDPDIESAFILIERERCDVATTMFDMTMSLLVGQGHDLNDFFFDEANLKSHRQKINWVVKVLAKLGAVDFKKTIEFTQVNDEEGDIVGMRRLPESKEENTDYIYETEE